MQNPLTARDVSPASPTVGGFDYIELFVGNVCHAMHYYCKTWGFEPVASRHPGPGSGDGTSIVMRQGHVTLLLTGAVGVSSPIAEHLRLHGEGVARIGLTVDNVEAVYEIAIKRGAKAVTSPKINHDDAGEIAWAEIEAPRGFTHVLVDRSAYKGAFFPGFRLLQSRGTPKPMFKDLDHISVAVEAGALNAWVDFYESVFGFEMVHNENVATGHSGMNSKVVQNPSGSCKFPLVEPATGSRKSQIQHFLDSYNGPGVQHLGLLTDDIAVTVSRLRDDGVEFLRIPSTYYDRLETRVGSLEGDLAKLQDLGILVDHDEWGRLLQVFARSCHDRATLFFEVIERRGGRGFGSGNIRALFEALEREK